MIDELLSELDSETLGEMLRFLSLELERVVDEQRIQAMKMLVERSRRTREAEESGARQAEERRRRADDEMFRQVRQVHIISSHLISSNLIHGYCPVMRGVGLAKCPSLHH